MDKINGLITIGIQYFVILSQDVFF